MHVVHFTLFTNIKVKTSIYTFVKSQNCNLILDFTYGLGGIIMDYYWFDYLQYDWKLDLVMTNAFLYVYGLPKAHLFLSSNCVVCVWMNQSGHRRPITGKLENCTCLEWVLYKQLLILNSYQMKIQFVNQRFYIIQNGGSGFEIGPYIIMFKSSKMKVDISQIISQNIFCRICQIVNRAWPGFRTLTF